MIKMRFSPSSAGFMWGNAVITDYPSACLRSIMLASRGVRIPIHPIYGELGEAHENWYANQLGDSCASREQVIKGQVTSAVTYSGRCDFTTKDGVIHECKSTPARKDCSYKRNHLAQLVSYMLRLEVPKGVIAVGYYIKPKDVFEQAAFKSYQVDVQDDGGVWVDDNYTGFMARDVIHHEKAAARAIELGMIEARPYAESAFKSPCRLCPFAKVCDRHDAGELQSHAAFVEAAHQAVTDYQPSEPKIRKRVAKPRK